MLNRGERFNDLKFNGIIEGNGGEIGEEPRMFRASLLFPPLLEVRRKVPRSTREAVCDPF